MTKNNNSFIDHYISQQRQKQNKELTMNVNKFELNAELGFKEEAGLKCMEFATQYMLKKAQYRLLNPLHPNECNLTLLNQQSQLMAELNAYCVKNPVMLTKSIQSNVLSLIQQQSPALKSKKSKPPQQQPKQQPTQYKQQQQQPKAQQSSVSEYTHPIIQRTSSEIISNRSSKQSLTSKKSKNKFEKVVRKSSLKQQNVQKVPLDILDFKKKKLPQLITKEQTIKQQDKVEKKFNIESADSQSDDNDSFDNLPLPSAQKQQNNTNNNQKYDNGNRQSITSQDLQSYHSSIIISQKKIVIDTVSEHLSQNQLSILNESQILPKEIRQTERKINKRQQQSRLRQQSLKRQQHQQENEVDKQQQVQQKQDNFGKEKQQLLKQIRRDFMKLESFDVQQQILMKRLHKIWTTQSQIIKQVKNLTWDQLTLPKPTFRSNLHFYAQVIE